MNHTLRILSAVERNMYKALLNHPEENLVLTWKRGKTEKYLYFLVGKKSTNARNGESKISFQNESVLRKILESK